MALQFKKKEPLFQAFAEGAFQAAQKSADPATIANRTAQRQEALTQIQSVVGRPRALVPINSGRPSTEYANPVASVANSLFGGTLNAIKSTDALTGVYQMKERAIDDFLRANMGKPGANEVAQQMRQKLLDEYQFAGKQTPQGVSYNLTPQENALKAAGTSLQTVSEVYPFRAGQLFLKGSSLLPRTLNAAGTGALVSGAGSVGAQLANTGRIDPLATAQDAAVGGTIAGAIPLLGAGISRLKTPRGSAPLTTNVGQRPTTSPVAPPLPGASTNAYTDYLVDKYIGGEKPTVKLRNPVTRALTGAQEVYRQGVDKARDAVNDALLQGVTSKNPVISRVAGAPSVAFNRFGLKDSIRQTLRSRAGQQENAGRVVRQLSNDLGDILAKTPDPQTSLQNIDRFFESEDYLARAYGTGQKLKFEQLSPAEQEVVTAMIDINKLRNDINLEVGNITKELHAKYADGLHSPRIYDLEVSKRSNTAGVFDTGVKQQRKELDKISDDVFAKREVSPVLRSMVRAEIALRDKATFDALKSLEANGLIRNTAPNNSFSKLEGGRYGKYAGKFIYNPVRSEIDRRLAYNTKAGQAAGDIVAAYQDTVLGTLDRFFKSTKTTLSPGTFLGNVVSNPVAFNSAAGVNPLTQSKNMAKAAGKLTKDARGKFDRSLYEARKQGVGVGDTGRELVGENRQQLSVKKKGEKNPYKVAGSIYGGVDQAAQVALYDELVRRGLTPELAARRVAAGTQDYASAGRLVQNLADTPILGKPFARFTPELIRLTKNNLLYNPVGTAAKVGTVAVGADILSKVANETEQERQARESAVGQTQLPGTAAINKLLTGRDADISLNVPVGDSAVNLARVTGLNYPIEPGGDASNALLRQLNPLADLTRTDAQGNEVFAPEQAVSSLTFRPIAEQVANRDFLGRTISDRDNKTYIEGVGDKGKKFAGEPSQEEQLKRRAEHLVTSYLPLANEAGAVASAATGQKDYYGKERTLSEAILRAAGVKTESNTPEARKKRLETQEYFEGKVGQVNEFLRKNPDLKDAYAKVTSNTRTRDTNTKTRDLVSPERWSVIKGDTSGRLFDQLKAEALYAKKQNGTPVDPIYLLNSKERAKEVLELRSRPTGDDVEREEILRATSTWYQKFEEAERKYYEDNDKFFAKLPQGGAAKQNPRVAAYGNVPHPTQSALIQRYYQERAKDEQAGQDFFKANADQLSADFGSYRKARLKEINAKRDIEGFAPISQDTYNNVTFGYEDDERKAINSLRYKPSGGGGGKKSDPTTNPYKYAVSLRAGGQAAKPRVSVKGGGKKAITAKGNRAGKPKVTIKRSSV